MNRITCFVLLLLLSAGLATAQNKYWIDFKDKTEGNYDPYQYLSNEAIENRTRFGISLYQYTDFPVSEAYLTEVCKTGASIQYVSRWLNSASAYLTPGQHAEISKMSFVERVVPVNSNIVITSTGIVVEPASIHIAMKQMQINAFLSDSLTGKGVTVGVIDAGFYEAQSDKLLKHIFNENKILEQRDFLAPERKDLITEKATDSDYHGRMVLDMIAGYNTASHDLYGMATNSRFILARTEHGDKEFRGEEDTWIAAMEWMDSKGVRLINTSLGYAMKMDDPKDNYTQEQMDGKTARITRAAQIATDEKGIFLVVSAGNEGGNAQWQIISAPADAEGVLSIGATRNENCERIDYSSIGPEFLPYLKPNVSCYSPNGTSFSAPAVTGFVACLMQKAPQLSNKKLKAVIEKSAHLYPYGNTFIGYGIPKASRALKLIENPQATFEGVSEKEVKGKSTVLKSDKTARIDAVIFHKKTATVVTDQQTLSFKNGKLKIRKPSGAVRTTVSYEDTVVEIIWK